MKTLDGEMRFGLLMAALLSIPVSERGNSIILIRGPI